MRSSLHSASPAGSWARRWRPSFSAPPSMRRKSSVECNCKAVPPHEAGSGPPLLFKQKYTTSFLKKFQYSPSTFKYRIFTSGFLLVEEWFAHHLPGRLVEVLHVHLPAFWLQVFHYFLHRAESSYSVTQNIRTLHPCWHHCRGLGLRLPLNTQIKQEISGTAATPYGPFQF